MAVPLTAIYFPQYLQVKDYKMYPKITPMIIINLVLTTVLFFTKSIDIFQAILLLEVSAISAMLYDFVNKK